MKEVKGNLITMAKEGQFDVIAHGTNCFCVMGAGIAVQMAKVFKADRALLEDQEHKGDYNKLGQIDWFGYALEDYGDKWKKGIRLYPNDAIKFQDQGQPVLIVVNAYTQYAPGLPGTDGIPLEYIALQLCLRKINHIFKGKRVGLPYIGAGLAGGNVEMIKAFVDNELPDCDVTLVEYDGS